MIVPTGIAEMGRTLPGLISEPAPALTTSPSVSPVGVVRSVPFGIERISPNQICCTANDDQMLQKVYLKMPITIALGAVLEQKGFEHSGIYVASFKHFSPLLSRLNEIDSGKYKYSRLLPKYNSQKNNMRSSNVVVTVVVE